MFADWPEVATDSAGLSPDAEVPLSVEQLDWATVIFVMEQAHRRKLSRNFKSHLNGKSLICLNIRDDYRYMQAELVDLLVQKAGRFLRSQP